MNIPDYRAMKNLIIKNCTSLTGAFCLDFKVNFKSLEESFEDMKLLPLPSMLSSKDVKREDVLVLSEYLKGQSLSWLNTERNYLIIPFLDKDSIDDKCEEMIAKLKMLDTQDPDNDKVQALAYILANYPCFNAAVISYISSDPSRYGKTQYEIKVRSNTVAIKLMDANNYKPN